MTPHRDPSLQTPAARPPVLLYGCTNSGHTYKIRLLLYLAQIPHQYHWVSLNPPKPERDPAFAAISKFGEVPVLQHGDQVLCQSNAILMHLAQHYQCFCGTPAEWPAIVEWLFWEADRIGASLSNLRFAHKYAPRPRQVMDYLTELTRNDLDILEQALKQAQEQNRSKTPFLLPSGPTIADISCAGYLYWLHEAHLSITDYPNIQRWLNALKALPHWGDPDKILQAGSAPAEKHF